MMPDSLTESGDEGSCDSPAYESANEPAAESRFPDESEAAMVTTAGCVASPPMTRADWTMWSAVTWAARIHLRCTDAVDRADLLIGAGDEQAGGRGAAVLNVRAMARDGGAK